jgi:hypothetical protein
MIVVGTILILFYGLVLFLSYWIPSRFGKRRLGKILCATLAVLLTFSLFSDSFAKASFTKRNAKSYLEDFQINLLDDFEIANKEISNSIDVSYRTFELKISQQDKQRIIQQIRNLEYYKDSVRDNSDIWAPTIADSSPNGFIGFRTSNSFVIQSNEQENNSPSPRSKVEISLSDNTLRYERVWGY